MMKFWEDWKEKLERKTEKIFESGCAGRMQAAGGS